jgi:hypothetical protein
MQRFIFQLMTALDSVNLQISCVDQYRVRYDLQNNAFTELYVITSSEGYQIITHCELIEDHRCIAYRTALAPRWLLACANLGAVDAAEKAWNAIVSLSWFRKIIYDQYCVTVLARLSRLDELEYITARTLERPDGPR